MQRIQREAQQRASLPVIVMCALLLGGAGCASTEQALMPTQEHTEAPLLTLVWIGTGKTERLDDGVWVRAPEFDYEFSVEQRRYADRWESIKSLRRRHPRYDGSAGPREQHMYFAVRYDAPDATGRVNAAIQSSLGSGQGFTDREFREATITLSPEVSVMAPFDTYRITQRYGYEAGELHEVVELIDHVDGEERPWVRNLEDALLFGPQPLAAPPTIHP
jgi:hypothetical protein